MGRYIRRFRRYITRKATESIGVPYFFICEQCTKNSGPLSATICAEARLRTLHLVGPLSSGQLRKLRGAAHANLVRTVKAVRRDAEKKQIYSDAFYDVCPYCRSSQSWAVGAMKKNMFSIPAVLLMLGLIFGAGCYFLSGAENAKIIAVIIGAAFLAGAAAVLAVNILRLRRKLDRLGPVAKRNNPVIDWRSVQNILY